MAGPGGVGRRWPKSGSGGTPAPLRAGWGRRTYALLNIFSISYLLTLTFTGRP